ncbi:MAG: FtsX-like permease family protein, partial [Oscillospiraceae bacterium]
DYGFTNPKKQWPHDRIDPTPDENGKLPKPFVNLTKDKLTLKTQKMNDESKVIEKQIKIVGKVKQDYSKGYETYSGLIMNLDDLVELEKEYIKINKIKVPTSKSKERTYRKAVVKVTDMKKVDEVVKAIEDMGYNTSSAASWRDEMKKQTQTMQLILAGLGSISLFVAAIGIANTMTMAIYERRREIGIMKVLGCELKNIRGMFLAESAGIGLLGGIVGIIVSYGLSFILNQVGGSMFGGGGGMGMNGEVQKVYLSIIPVWLAVAGMAFSTFVGIISGYVPANKAVKISALTAIKNE